MRILNGLKVLFGPVLVLAVLAGAWVMRERFATSQVDNDDPLVQPAPRRPPLEVLELGQQARKNLGLRVRAMRPTDFWRTSMIPGVVADRPGISDRGVTSPAVGSIAAIHVFPGDTVCPGERIVTIELFSEYLQATQNQLFQASDEIARLQQEIARLSGVASSGGIAKAKLIELRNNVQRQRTLTRSARQELLNRGLSPGQVDRIATGDFVSRVDVVAPPPAESLADDTSGVAREDAGGDLGSDQKGDAKFEYEVQSLDAELGQTVAAGQRIAALANHQRLYVVGHAFKREAGQLEQAAQQSREIEIEFADDDVEMWSPLKQSFQIRHLSNSIDTESRTFDFFIPLENQSRRFVNAGERFLVWRFRPGQRTRIHVPVECLEDIFVLPTESIARMGPDAYVFRQNGDLFNAIAVNILHEDRRSVVIANDGSITPGTFIAQNAGASLYRIMKSQSARGDQPGFHVHADGTVHGSH
ncbi:MAG: MchE protein [Planctomycetota bacterium]